MRPIVTLPSRLPEFIPTPKVEPQTPRVSMAYPNGSVLRRTAGPADGIRSHVRSSTREVAPGGSDAPSPRHHPLLDIEFPGTLGTRGQSGVRHLMTGRANSAPRAPTPPA